jgi:hypothetical protein
MFAEFAEPAAVLDPVVTIVMRLLVPRAMTDDRIAQTEGTPAKDRLRTSCPVEARLAMIRRKWDKGNRTAWKALSLSRILRGYVPRMEPSSFLLNFSSRRITQFFLSLDRRIGRLNAQNPWGAGAMNVNGLLETRQLPSNFLAIID